MKTREKLGYLLYNNVLLRDRHYVCLNHGKIKSRSGKSSFTFDTEFHFHKSTAARIFSLLLQRHTHTHTDAPGEMYWCQARSTCFSAILEYVSAGFVGLYNIQWVGIRAGW